MGGEADQDGARSFSYVAGRGEDLFHCGHVLECYQHASASVTCMRWEAHHLVPTRSDHSVGGGRMTNACPLQANGVGPVKFVKNVCLPAAIEIHNVVSCYFNHAPCEDFPTSAQSASHLM